jgi:hypothetical protein
VSIRGDGSRLGSIGLPAYTASLMTFPAEKFSGSTQLRRQVAVLAVTISLMTVATGVHSGEPADGLVTALGAQAYRARAAATKALRAELVRVDEQTKDWITATDADVAAAHDSDGARALYRALEIASTNDLDPEVSTRAAELLADGAYSAAFFGLDESQQRVAGMRFASAVQNNGQSVTARVYTKHGYAIADLGTVRIAKKGFPCSPGRLTIALSSHGSSSRSGSGATRFEYKNVTGVATFEWGNDITFSLLAGVLTLGEQKMPFDRRFRVVFLDENNEAGAIVRLHKSPFTF